MNDNNGKLATAAEIILLFLSSPQGRVDPSQKSISTATGITRHHVPRELKKLKDKGLIIERQGHIKGSVRKVKVYELTDIGVRNALELKRQLGSEKVECRRGGEGGTVCIDAIWKDIPVHEIVQQVNARGHVTIGEGAADIGTVVDLIGRDGEMKRIKEWYQSKEKKILVIYGGLGSGRTALVGSAIPLVGPSNRTHWLDLTSSSDRSLILNNLLGLSPKSKNMKDLVSVGELTFQRGTLLIFDNYGEVSEEVVDLFTTISDQIAGSDGIKVIVIAEETTPFYSRFYHKGAGHIQEMSLKGLDMDSCDRFLGGNLEGESLRRIYLLTKGKPGALRALIEGDIDGLRRTTRLTSEEIRLLLFLKTKRKVSAGP